MVTVYKGYIRPLIEYDDVIWHSSLTSNQTHQLERVQKMLWMCVMLIVYQPGGSNPFPNVAGLISCSLRAEARHMVSTWGNPLSPVLALIDMLVVQSHIMWSWSTVNSCNWTICFLFSPLLACFPVGLCFSVVCCCTYSFVSGHTVFFPSSLILYFVIWPYMIICPILRMAIIAVRQTLLMCWFNCKESSITRPRFRASESVSMCEVPTVTWDRRSGFLNLEEMWMTSVLVSFRSSLFSTDHARMSLMHSSNFCNWTCLSDAGDVIYIWVSSAYIIEFRPCAATPLRFSFRHF